MLSCGLAHCSGDQRDHLLGLGLAQERSADHARLVILVVGRGRSNYGLSPTRRHDRDAFEAGLDHRPGRFPARRGMYSRSSSCHSSWRAHQLGLGFSGARSRGRALHGSLDRGDAPGWAARTALCGRIRLALPLISGCGFAAVASRCSPWRTAGRSRSNVAAGLLGIGIGLAFAAMANLIVEAVPPDRPACATGVNTITRTIGGTFGGLVARRSSPAGAGPRRPPSRARVRGDRGAPWCLHPRRLAIPRTAPEERGRVPAGAVSRVRRSQSRCQGVSTRGPSSVTATVNSKWAARSRRRKTRPAVDPSAPPARRR
jgi:hypothetical protein